MKIKKLIETINDNPDKLHLDYTPSVHELIKIGRPSLLPVLDLMLSSDEFTRLHAQRVIERVVEAEKSFFIGKGWVGKDPHEQDDALRELLKKLGSLDYEQPLPERKKSVALWRKYLKHPFEDVTVMDEEIKNWDADLIMKVETKAIIFYNPVGSAAVHLKILEIVKGEFEDYQKIGNDRYFTIKPYYDFSKKKYNLPIMPNKIQYIGLKKEPDANKMKNHIGKDWVFLCAQGNRSITESDFTWDDDWPGFSGKRLENLKE